MSDISTKTFLICGATGQQGGAVLKALVAQQFSYPVQFLALTRNTTSPAAKKLEADPRVTLLVGDLSNVPAIFEAAGGKGSIHAVFLVTLPSMKKAQEGVVDKEVAQGCAMFDGALANGVKHFVFSSVDRGGDVKSWDNPTKVSHFITKHQIEHHIRDKSQGQSDMTYTILRPVAFMDNYRPNIIGRIFAAAWAQMEPKKLQMVAARDIGIIAAKALTDSESEDFKNTAIGLAGDELTQSEGNEAMWQAKKRPMVQTYWPFASFLKWAVGDVGVMFKWFEEEGYGADLQKCRRLNPDMMDFETWLREESKHQL